MLAKSVPALRAIVMDHRGHGESHGISGENTIKSCAGDVDRLLQSQGLAAESLSILCGHSFGGKVALYYIKSLYEQRRTAATTTDGRRNLQNRFALPQNTWILDCLPGVFQPHSIVEETGEKASRSHSVGGVFDVLSSSPSTFPNVAHMQQLLLSKGVPMSTVQWLTSECRPVASSDSTAMPSAAAAAAAGTTESNNKDAGAASPLSSSSSSSSSFQLGFDISVTSELFRDFCQTDMWDFLYNFDGRGMAANGADAKIHFVRAGKNPLWKQHNGRILGNFDKICSSNANIHLHTMEHVGHWIQAEDARGLMELIRKHSAGL
jgi:pimeloyl-ACP methyl ester carboxylesterase